MFHNRLYSLLPDDYLHKWWHSNKYAVVLTLTQYHSPSFVSDITSMIVYRPLPIGTLNNIWKSLCHYGNDLCWTGCSYIVSGSFGVFPLFHIRYDEHFILVSNDLFGGLAFLHLWMQLAWYSFHSNSTIEQFRWYYVLDHVLAFQLWYIHPPLATDFECWSVYATICIWSIRFHWSLVLELKKGIKCWWQWTVCFCPLFIGLRAFPGREHHHQWSDALCRSNQSSVSRYIIFRFPMCIRYHALSQYGAWRKDKRDIEITDVPFVCCLIHLYCHSVRWIPCSWTRCVMMLAWKYWEGTQILCRIYSMIFVFEDKT